MSVALAKKQDARETLARFADHPSAFLALNRETRHFTSSRTDGLIAYRACGGWLFQIGNVVAPESGRAALLADFRAFAARERKRVCALEVRDEQVELYRAAGFRLNQLGTSFTLDLARFTTRGARFMQLRNKVNRARREGLRVAELGVDVAPTPEITAELEAITSEWLRAKGKSKLLEFMVGELGLHADRRIFIATQDARVVAFVSYVPSYGRFAGLMHDLSRRADDAPPGAMELVNATAIERFQREGIAFLNFGFTPFVGISSATDCVAERSRVVSWLLAMLERHGERVYPARSQAQYKLKWEPQHQVPEFIAFEGRFRLGCLVRLLELTRSI